MTTTTTNSNPRFHYLEYIECSEQPLDFAFHPKLHNIVAAALVDGTLEVHDIQVDEDEINNNNDYDEDEQPESILSSTAIHTKVLKSSKKKSNKNKSSKKIESCRCIEFNKDGTHIYTGGSSGSLCCVDSTMVCKFNNFVEDPTTTTNDTKRKVVLWKIDNATTDSTVDDENGSTISNTRNNPLVCIKSYDDNIFATGDDNGGIRVWDERKIIRRSSGGEDQSGVNSDNDSVGTNNNNKLPDGCIYSWKLNDDYISDIEFSNDGKTLIATSADGRLAIFHLQFQQHQHQQSSSSNEDGQHTNSKKKKQQQQQQYRLSDDQEDELLSLKIMKNSTKVVCGTQQGVLSIFSWGIWGDCSDRFPGHPSSIESILKIDEDTLLTGSSDGHIRVVQIQPDKFLGILNNNTQDANKESSEGFPIEKLDFNSNKRIVGSISSGHDNYIRLWDASILHDEDNDDNEEEEEEKKQQLSSSTAAAAKAAEAVTNPTRRTTATTKTTTTNSDDEWDDMGNDNDSDGDGSDDDDDSDDSDDSDDNSNANNQKRKATKNDKRKDRLKTDNEKFFDDL